MRLKTTHNDLVKAAAGLGISEKNVKTDVKYLNEKGLIRMIVLSEEDVETGTNYEADYFFVTEVIVNMRKEFAYFGLAKQHPIVKTERDNEWLRKKLG